VLLGYCVFTPALCFPATSTCRIKKTQAEGLLTAKRYREKRRNLNFRRARAEVLLYVCSGPIHNNMPRQVRIAPVGRSALYSPVETGVMTGGFD
jgi:hypothetical protein